MKSAIGVTLALLGMMTFRHSYAQDVEQLAKADPLSVSGGLTASGIYITPLDSATAQKELTYYLSGSLNVTAFGVVSVPMSFAYTNNALTSTLTCPFNRFSIAPSWRWVKTYMGYASMSFSPYIMGREFMGGGVELTPPDMPWRFTAYYGRYNKSQAIDSVHTEAVYRRQGGGVRVGFEKERFRIAVNANKAYDVSSSLTFGERDTNYVAPKSNVAGSIEASVSPLPNLTIAGEYALSLINPNTDAGSDEFRHTAYKMSVSQTFDKGSIGVTYERVAPEYESFGSYYNTNDFRNITANLSANIADKVSVAADVGFQRDNLDSEDANTNSQLIYSISANANITERLSLMASVSNIQSYVHIRDILETVTQTNQYQNLDTLSFTELNFSTTNSVGYRWGEETQLRHNLNAGYTYQQASHEQRNSQRFVSNRLSNYNLNYALSHVPTKITASVGGNYNHNRMPEATTDVLTLSASVARVFFERLQTSASATYSKVSSLTDSRVLNARLAAAYTLLKAHTFNFSVTALNNSVRPDTEYTFNMTYNYTFGWTKKAKEKEKNKEEKKVSDE